MVEPPPKQNPLEEMMHVSPLTHPTHSHWGCRFLYSSRVWLGRSPSPLWRRTILMTLGRVWASSHWPISCISRPWSRINIDLTRWTSWDGLFIGHGDRGTDYGVQRKGFHWWAW
jgi:hypothetical protein